MITENKKIRKCGLYGVWGSSTNITDGRYTYFRYPDDMTEQEINQYTLMPTHITSFFTDEEIAIYKGPTLVNSKILISNQKGTIIIIDANNGTEIDTVNFDELAIPPIPVNGSLLFLTTNGILSAYE